MAEDNKLKDLMWRLRDRQNEYKHYTTEADEAWISRDACREELLEYITHEVITSDTLKSWFPWVKDKFLIKWKEEGDFLIEMRLNVIDTDFGEDKEYLAVSAEIRMDYDTTNHDTATLHLRLRDNKIVEFPLSISKWQEKDEGTIKRLAAFVNRINERYQDFLETVNTKLG